MLVPTENPVYPGDELLLSGQALILGVRTMKRALGVNGGAISNQKIADEIVSMARETPEEEENAEEEETRQRKRVRVGNSWRQFASCLMLTPEERVSNLLRFGEGLFGALPRLHGVYGDGGCE